MYEVLLRHFEFQISFLFHFKLKFIIMLTKIMILCFSSSTSSFKTIDNAQLILFGLKTCLFAWFYSA